LELQSLALYILVGFRRNHLESNEAALKYFLLGAFASGFLLYGIALLYGATGTTNLSRMALYLVGSPLNPHPLLIAGGVLVVIGFGFKVALVPFHMWTPDAYQGAPTPVTGFMAAGAKAAGFAAILRVFSGALGSERLTWRPAVWVLAVVTMVVGASVAIVQSDVKRM